MQQRQLLARPHLKYSSQYTPCPKCSRLKKATAELCWNCRYARPEITQPDDQTIRNIALTKGQITTVDVCEYERFERDHWCAMWSEDTKSYYAVRVDKRNGKRVTILMHREIMNAGPDDIVDHIKSGDTLNNRRLNLRLSTPSQSQHNKRLQCNNSSGFIGVDFVKKSGKWRARIKTNNQEITIGWFDTAESAGIARDLKAVELRGEFAVLNFPEKLESYRAQLSA